MYRTTLPRFRIFFLLWLTAYTSLTSAQTLYTRGAKITVTPNTTISISGDVENEGTILNRGDLKVSGSWINSGMYEAGEGRITFNSTSHSVPQIIHHNGQTIAAVTISGGTRKIITSDIVIGSAIDFDHGIVEAAGKSRVIFNPEVQIRGASDISHVHGAVFHRGGGSKLFPIGNGLTYLPVGLPEVGDPNAFIGVQAFEFENISLTKSPTLAAISDKRYWYIDVVSGTLPGSRVVLPLRAEAWIDDPENFVVVQSTSPTDEFVSIGRTVVTPESGRITSGQNISMPFVALATAAAEVKLNVYNAVSGNGDSMNDFVRIESIELYPQNKFTVFNRWGDKVFQIENYDNIGNVFRGRANIHGDSELVSGTYFYVLEIPGQESLRGFIAVKNQ